jgi:Cdc6-like AAA superfamily ATPase
MADITEDEAQTMDSAAGHAFSPSAPIHERDFFAGRKEQLQLLLEAIGTRGQHAVVYGERGVGKTSIISMVALSTKYGKEQMPVIRQNCSSGDTFGRIWRRAFMYMTKTMRAGASPDVMEEISAISSAANAGPDSEQVISLCLRMTRPVVFVFDEFDQIDDRTITRAMAEVIKALSDFSCHTKIIVVGVGDTIDTLMEQHASIQRAIKQVKVRRMGESELTEIISNATRHLRMECTKQASGRIVRLSQGLPHYVHSLGLQSMRTAISCRTRTIAIDHVTEAIEYAVKNTSQSLLESYLSAVSSPRQETLHKWVLLACALAKTDGLWYFTPASVKVPMSSIGKPLEVSAFTNHLNKFASRERGEVLRRVGEGRRFRYRFVNPLMQPFVVMQSLSERLVDAEAIDQLLTVFGTHLWVR